MFLYYTSPPSPQGRINSGIWIDAPRSRRDSGVAVNLLLDQTAKTAVTEVCYRQVAETAGVRSASDRMYGNTEWRSPPPRVR